MSAAWEALRREAGALPPKLREQLAAEWARAAQFEHASIASFGRFALELLAVAAPAELVERAHRAAIDEIEHARLCFSLASIYAGASLGPGPLPMPLSREPGAFTKPTLASMVHATVLEGCVNETLAAIEAQAARQLAEVDVIREALTAIERQESEHASLAFAFAGWAIASGGPDVREAARAAFAMAATTIGTDAVGAEAKATELDSVMRRHGRLSPATRSELRKRATVEVIAPAARTLLGG